MSRILPDFQGGLVLAPWDPATGKRKLYRLDGMTGQRLDFNLGTDHAYAVGLFADGTLSAVINTTQEVVGLDILTGAEKFRIRPAAGAGYGDMIVAGDGYGYRVMTVYSGGSEQLKVLQLSSSGAYQLFDIATVNDLGANLPNLPPGSDFGMGKNHAPALISNGDNGVLLSWGETLSDNQNTCPSSDWNYHLTAVSTAGAVSTHDGPRLPGQTVFPVSPLLERQDGTFVGAALTGPYCFQGWSVVQTSMVVFTASGSVLWSVANEEPRVATADNEVIGKSGTTYDQNGGAVSQGPLYTQSWTGNVYRIGSIEQLLISPTLLAATFTAFQPAIATPAKPLPDSVRAESDQVTAAIGTVLRAIKYAPYQGIIAYRDTITITEHLQKIGGDWPPPQTSCNAPTYNPNDPAGTFCSFSTTGEFNDRITTTFVRRQKFFVEVPSKVRKYQVWIYPCTAQNRWGERAWGNVLDSSSGTSVLVNGEAGSTVQRTCTQ